MKATMKKTKRPAIDHGPRPTVFIVDDDEAMRESLEFLLKSAGLSVEAFDSAEAFLRHLDPAMDGCLLLDVRMPGMSGLDLQARLERDAINLPVILLTAHGDVPMAVRAMRAGAFDFIEKPCNDQVLLDRVNAAVRHDRQRRDDDDAARRVQKRAQHLSPREREVMQLVIEGLLNKQIASRLSISIKTVEVHRARVMEKMEADSLAELVRMTTLAGINQPASPTGSNQ